MPELPEVETLKRQLEKTLKGKIIVKVEVLQKKSFFGNPQKIIGLKIKKVERRAKYLIINLNKNLNLLIHLKLTGQLIYQPLSSKSLRIVGGHPSLDWIAKLPNKHTRAIINFHDKSRLFFNDMRLFGWMRIISKQALSLQIGKLGVEPLSKNFSEEYLKKIFSKSSRPIKLILMDQEKISGIGNIYSNEALFAAGINPQKRAKDLKNKEIKKLRYWILKVLKLGIKHGGASEDTYRHLNGSLGNYQKHFLVYQKQGQRCQKCHKAIIKKIQIGGRGTFFCPNCQK